MIQKEANNGMNRLFGGLLAKRSMPKNASVDLSELGKCYAMVMGDDGEAEITLYGNIVEEIPRDWLTDEPIEGMYISLEAFLQDLKTLENAKSITVRISSAGGDAAAAITIHNRLKDLKAKITVIVDGVALLAGSLIMCAGDTVKVYPASLIMIQKSWRYMVGIFNSTELRKAAESLDAIDKAQANIYKNKTGLSEEAILAMMEKTFYMTGEEAVDYGFADEVLDKNRLKIAASADRRTLYVNGQAIRLPTAATTLPNNIKIKRSQPHKRMR